MEKKNLKKTQSTKNYKLPILTESKSQLHLLMHHIPEISSSSDRFKDLRKLCLQYKSNAQILTNSPYFTNRQQKKHAIVVSNPNKYDIDTRKREEILNLFRKSHDVQQAL